MGYTVWEGRQKPSATGNPWGRGIVFDASFDYGKNFLSICKTQVKKITGIVFDACINRMDVNILKAG